MGGSAEWLALIGRTLGTADLDRTALRAAFDAARAQGDARRCMVLGAALVLCIDTDGGHYAGFEEAVAALRLHRHARLEVDDPALRLVADGGDLMAGAFDALDNPALVLLAEDVVRGLANQAIPTAIRLLAAMGAASYFDARVDIEKIWWLDLALRDVLAEPDAPVRLAAEWHRAVVVACYSCGQAARGEELRRRHAAQAAPADPGGRTEAAAARCHRAAGRKPHRRGAPGAGAGRAAVARQHALPGQHGALPRITAGPAGAAPERCAEPCAAVEPAPAGSGLR